MASGAEPGPAPTPLHMVAVRPDPDGVASLLESARRSGQEERIDQVAETLAAGVPAASMELISQVSSELGAEYADQESLIYWAAIGERLTRPEFASAMAGIERMMTEGGGAEGWDAGDEAELALQLLAAALAPLAGQGPAQSLDDAAFDLRLAAVRVDDYPAVLRRDHLGRLDRARRRVDAGRDDHCHPRGVALVAAGARGAGRVGRTTRPCSMPGSFTSCT